MPLSLLTPVELSPEKSNTLYLNTPKTASSLKLTTLPLEGGRERRINAIPDYIYNTFLSVFPSPKRQKKVTVQPMGKIAGWRRRKNAVLPLGQQELILCRLRIAFIRGDQLPLLRLLGVHRVGRAVMQALRQCLALVPVHGDDPCGCYFISSLLEYSGFLCYSNGATQLNKALLRRNAILSFGKNASPTLRFS